MILHIKIDVICDLRIGRQPRRATGAHDVRELNEKDGRLTPAAIFLQDSAEASPAGVVFRAAELFGADGVGASLLDLGLLTELGRAIELLRVLAAVERRSGPLDDFKRAFAARFEGQTVPLAKVLDEDQGIGFSGPPPPRQPSLGRPFHPIHAYLLERLAETADAPELVLTESDSLHITELAGSQAIPLQERSCAVIASLLPLPKTGALAHKPPELMLERLMAPAGVALAAVESSAGPAVLSCLAELRRLDLGPCAIAVDAADALDDLTLTQLGERLVLHSLRLRRQVVLLPPFSQRAPAAAFLAALSREQTLDLRFSWGPLARAALKLPQVRSGRILLAAASQRLSEPPTPLHERAWPAARAVCIPFVRGRERTPAQAQPLPSPIGTKRSFVPGSEWLYLRLFANPAVQDEVLCTVGPTAEELAARGISRGWFFLRYDDPEPHLRLRLSGDPQRLLSEVLPALEASIAPLRASGLIWRVELDTYQREIERYGGSEAILLAERLFQADSEAVLGILGRLQGPEAPLSRFQLALLGIELLLDDLDLWNGMRAQVVAELRQGLAAELSLDEPRRRQLGEKFREHGPALHKLFSAACTPGGDRQHPLGPGIRLFARRSQTVTQVAAALRELSSSGRLSRSISELSASFVHMHCNRLLTGAQRPQELVLYDMLARIFRSRERGSAWPTAKGARACP